MDSSALENRLRFLRMQRQRAEALPEAVRLRTKAQYEQVVAEIMALEARLVSQKQAAKRREEWPPNW